jgi:hypothetical protein
MRRVQGLPWMSRLPGLPLWRLRRWRMLRFMGSLPLVLGRRAVQSL